MIYASFAPFQDFARRLIPHTHAEKIDGSHDISHLQRVWRSSLYDPQDPGASHRPYDDKRFAVDHFHTKLLHLAEGFQTATGARIAGVRHERLQRFLTELMEEVEMPS